jgi:hypothetical protein
MGTRRGGVQRSAPPSILYGASRQRFSCAAPHPSLALTGEWSPCSHPFEEAGMRVRRRFEAAAGHDCVSVHAPLPWGESRNTCLVQPHTGRASIQKSRQDMRPTVDCPGAGTRKKVQSPLLGVVCLLTIGGLLCGRCCHAFFLACPLCRGPRPSGHASALAAAMCWGRRQPWGPRPRTPCSPW